MGELLQFPHEHSNSDYIALAQAIGNRALQFVAEAYGDDNEDTNNATPAAVRQLAYHNADHSRHVARAAVTIAKDIGLDEYDQALTSLAAKAHDIVQEGVRGDMELRSARWAEKAMLDQGFQVEDTEIVFLAILATQPVFDERGVMVGQWATRLYYPNERARAIGHCVASGDMAGLYSAEGPLHSLSLYKELHRVGEFEEPSMDDFVRFQSQQLELMKLYEYPLLAAKARFERLKRPVMEHHAMVLAKVRNGEVTTFEQIQALHQDFYEQYRHL